MPGLWQPLLALLLAHWVVGAQAGTSGSVTGTVEFEQVEAPVVPPRYRVRTRSPILEPDPQVAVVYLEGGTREAPQAVPMVVAIVQEGYQFRPAVTVVRRGASVSFPNQDDEFHSVFSYSAAKRFDLGRYRKDEPSPPVAFDEPGLVKIYCEIHKHMRHLLLVVDTPWYTVTGPDGSFRLDGVPPGEYRIRAFLPDETTLEGAVRIVAGETARVDLPGP